MHVCILIRLLLGAGKVGTDDGVRGLGDVLGRREEGEAWPQTAGGRTVPGSVTEQGSQQLQPAGYRVRGRQGGWGRRWRLTLGEVGKV